MEEEKVYTVIGLMSGTSVDGIDVALVRTDGISHVERIGFTSTAYDADLKNKIKAQFGKSVPDAETKQVERELTLKHAEAVKEIVKKFGIKHVDLIGFHGQTIFHDPDNRKTVQIGDGELLAKETGIDVVHDFRSEDIRAGGQGAPLIPLYHQALAKHYDVPQPCVFLNIGGVSNVTWVGKGDDAILAFDCGTGNALIDDVMEQEFNASYDHNGETAQKGRIDDLALRKLMANPFFDKQPPKSLDRDAWDISCLEGVSAKDKVSTLTEFTVQGIIKAESYMSAKPLTWYVCGGGRHNQTIMRRLSDQVDGDVLSIDVLGLDGDALEAEGFGYLAVRSVKNMPLSLPSTTGVKTPQTGGQHRRRA